jgi:hypothetical protein
MELSSSQLHAILKRFPSFELSYEAITHKKVYPLSYELCLAVPSGRKYFLWFTFYRTRDVCYLMELNKDKRIVKASVVSVPFGRDCSIGTILYGTVVREDGIDPFFVIEDIYYYKGISFKQQPFYDRLCYLKQMFEKDRTELTKDCISVYLPFFWLVRPNKTTGEVTLSSIIPDNITTKIIYNVHHIQYRDLTNIRPYLNVNVGLKETISPELTLKTHTINKSHISKYVPNYGKPQYKYPTVFRIMADVQYDIYHLYACGSNCRFVYYDVAYIPNYKKSVFMNGLFRNIRENTNLDYIEESDDDEDFENTQEDKYVDLKKEIFMECSFHTKFKRWVPICVVGKSEKVIHIYKLAT